MSDNAYINDLEERNAELRRELAEAKDKIAQLEAFDAANKAAIERSWTFTPEHLAKVRNDPVSITDRLRGDYGGRSFPASAICVVAADMLDEAKSQLTAANATIAKMDRDMDQLCDERDNAEESLSQAYCLVTGNSPEWSNHFGHSHALEDIDDAIRTLKEAAKTANATIAACKEAGFIDAEGRVRKVLGTLPVTEDGCVIGHRATVWGFFDDGEPGWCDFVDVTVGGDDWDQTPGGLYSTNEAAAAANGGGQ